MEVVLASLLSVLALSSLTVASGVAIDSLSSNNLEGLLALQPKVAKLPSNGYVSATSNSNPSGPMAQLKSDGMIRLQKRSPIPFTLEELDEKKAKFQRKKEEHRVEKVKYARHAPDGKWHKFHESHEDKWHERLLKVELHHHKGSEKEVYHYQKKLDDNPGKSAAWKSIVLGNLEFWREFHALTSPDGSRVQRD